MLFTDHFKEMVFCGFVLEFLSRACHSVLSFPCSLVATCWESADLLALLCEMFSFVVVTIPYGLLGQALY